MSVDFEDLFASIRQPKIEQKPWMRGKRMELVTPETISRVVDECIASGRYALDLETTGLDSTVFDGRTKDTIVGFCLSPDGNVGYYIPVMHPGHESSCVPQSLAYSEMRRLANSSSVAVFHNARFDQEFLEFCGGEPIGDWDDIKKWDDTLILAYLRNSKERNKGLKTLAKNELGMEMIELKELFSHDDLKKYGKNFSRLDPAWAPTLWYATSDAICTYLLYDKLYPEAIDPRELNERKLPSQKYIYIIEKGQVAATRWMMRIGIPIDRDKVCELIRVGQREWLPSLTGFYDEASKMLGRDVLPGYVKILSDPSSPYYFNTEEVGVEIMDKVRQAREEAARRRMDPVQVTGPGKVKFQTIPKSVSKIGPEGQESGTEIVEFPVVYDVLIPEQLGLALRELGVPGLKTTEKSGQVSTSKKEIDLLLANLGDEFSYVKKFKRFREVAKALSSNLMPLYDGTDKNKGRGARVRINFDGFKTDTARYSTPAPEDADMSDQDWIGLVPWNLHSSPTFSPERPECMARIREVIRAEDGYFIVAIDYSGQELRVVSNLSGEPVWVTEFFRCSGCGHTFDRGGKTPPPPAPPPPFCPTCGSDKIGDIHSTTAVASFGEAIKNDPSVFKECRKLAKSINFGLCYGGGANVIVNAAKVSKEEGWRIKRQFDETYRTLSAWWEEIREYGRRTGFVLSGFNRRYPIPDLHHEENWIRAQAERNAVNSPVQASGSDIMKNAMSLVFRELKARGWLELVRMIITIHDELVFEIHGSILAEAVEVLHDIMLRKALARMEWRVPLTCDTEVGFDWTVPWNLTFIKYGKKSIPPELAGVLKPDFVLKKSDVPTTRPTCILVVPELSVDQLMRIYATRLKYAGTGKGSLLVEHEQQVVIEDIDAGVDPVAAKAYFTSLSAAEAASSLAQPAERQVLVPKLPAGVPMTIRLLGVPDILTPARVASAIAKCRGRGNHGVRVVGQDGTVLIEDMGAGIMPQEVMLYVADYAELVT